MPNYICDLCGYQSKNKEEVISHVGSKHGVENPSKIDLGKWFSDMTQELLFLYHPHTRDIFSGYGLQTAIPHQIKGILMVDRPKPVSQKWLDTLESIYGYYELYQMTDKGERGLACLMNIEESSWQHVRSFEFDLSSEILEVIQNMNPLITLNMHWDNKSRLWISEIMRV